MSCISIHVACKIVPMAVMIPDKLRGRASRGEEICFDILQKLPGDCIVYYEPVINRRHPDFVVILPRHGVIVIEVKGWYATNLIRGDSENIFINDLGVETSCLHPCRQARGYMFQLMDKAREDQLSSLLLHPQGHELSGRFIFPFGNFAILSNIQRKQLSDEWDAIFQSDSVITRDELVQIESLSGFTLEDNLVNFFNPFWPIEVFTEQTIDLIRFIIGGKIIGISDTPASRPRESGNGTLGREVKSLKVLDLEQEKSARNIGNGHRLVFGVAGSGKTVLLISRVRLLVQQLEPNEKVLVLCYNVGLASYLIGVLKDLASQVDVMNFHRLGKKLGVKFKKGEEEEDYGQRVMDAIISDPLMPHSYKALAIDEAQDFASTWFQCALELIDEPMDADVLIVGDGTQGIFRRKPFSWIEVGIQAQGRTIYLKHSYRTSAEIMRLAEVFSFNEAEQEEGGIPAVSANQYLRKCHFKPHLLKCTSFEHEVSVAKSIIKELVYDGHWMGAPIPEKLDPREIGVFYRSKRATHIIIKLKNELEALSVPFIWLSEPSGKNRDKVWEAGIKIQTGQSCKGLQYKAVIILEANQMPMKVGDITEDLERKLFYTMITRAEDYLAVLCTGTSTFTEQLESVT